MIASSRNTADQQQIAQTGTEYHMVGYAVLTFYMLLCMVPHVIQYIL